MGWGSDLYWKATADGSNVDQWTYDGGKNQLWTSTHLGANGANVHLCWLGGNDYSQQWSIQSS